MTVTHGKNQHSDSRPLQEVPPTQKGAGLGEEDTPEERELSVEEVRQKLQRSRRPLVSYDKEEPGDIPEDEEQGGHQLGLNSVDSHMQFVCKSNDIHFRNAPHLPASNCLANQKLFLLSYFL